MENTNKNNFDLLRFFAALQVAFVHAVEHLHIPVPTIVMKIVGWFPGVIIFFTISGFLIAGSAKNSKKKSSYMMNRVLRIWPALWMSTLISVVVLYVVGAINVPWYGLLPWVIAASTFAPFTPAYLKEWGTGSVNGSLWTIPIEIQFYVLLPLLLAWIEVSKWRQFILFLCALALGCIYLYMRTNHPALPIVKVAKYALPAWLYVFLIGVFLRLHWDRICGLFEEKFTFYLAFYVLLMIFCDYFDIGAAGNSSTPLVTIPLAILVLSFAYTFRNLSSKILKNIDPSYGIYIYHMIVVNVFVHYGMLYNFEYLIISMLFSILFGVASWKIIEQPAMKLKRVFK